MQHPLQLEMADPQAVNSADRAIFRIVEMGFSPEDARGALKITDMGDGLRVDRAVEFLLRQAEGVAFYQSTAITQ
jgi:UBA/TS-N domain